MQSDRITAADVHAAMTQLRKGKITPDEFRAVMRKSREQNGAQHDAIKARAAAAFNRA